MTAKTFEVRDRMTFIPVLAVKLDPSCERDRYLIARGGFSTEPEQQASYVLLTKLCDGRADCCHDPYDWPDARTMRNAHMYIIKEFDNLESGAVVDVEFVLGETASLKVSEQHGYSFL